MADLVPNPPGMRLLRGKLIAAKFGEGMQHGDVCFRSAKGFIRCTASDPERANVTHMAWSQGQSGDEGSFLDLKGALFTLGTGVINGQTYVVSRNEGKIAPKTDLTGIDIVSHVAIGQDGTWLNADRNTQATGIGGGGTPQGSWNVATNTPDIGGTAPHTSGDHWTVSVGGTRTLGNLTNQVWEVGDQALYDESAPGNWVYVPKQVPIGVVSWNGRDGEVVAEDGDYTAEQVGADPAGSAATVQGNLDTHTGDTGNPHSVTAAQANADPAGSAAAVQANLDAQKLGDHADTSFTTPQAGDIQIFTSGNEWVNAGFVQDAGGAMASTAVNQSFDSGGNWQEVVPTTATVSFIYNMTYANGRFTLDYQNAPDQPDGNIYLAAGFTISVEFPVANTEAEFSLAVGNPPAPIPGVDNVKVSGGNGGQQTVGTRQPLTLPPTLTGNYPDGTSISVVGKTNNPVTILAFVMTADAEPVNQYAERTVAVEATATKGGGKKKRK